MGMDKRTAWYIKNGARRGVTEDSYDDGWRFHDGGDMPKNLRPNSLVEIPSGVMYTHNASGCYNPQRADTVDWHNNLHSRVVTEIQGYRVLNVTEIVAYNKWLETSDE